MSDEKVEPATGAGRTMPAVSNTTTEKQKAPRKPSVARVPVAGAVPPADAAAASHAEYQRQHAARNPRQEA